MADELVSIARFRTAVEAHEARIELESQGIECFVADETGATVAFPGAFGIGDVRLQVRERDADKAVEILGETPAEGALEVESEEEPADAAQEPEEEVEEWFLALPDQLEAKIAQWRELAPDRLFIDHVEAFSGDRVYAVTLSDFSVPHEGKRRHYFAQPHAHEPGATAGMIDVIEQLATGSTLRGEPTPLDVDEVLAKTVLTFNPIGNPQGRDAAPVLYWDGSEYSNDQFWCWMRGEDPDQPGKMWHRFDLWDDREHTVPDPVGIVYEQIDEHRYVEPNRSHLSSYFKLFFEMDKQYGYERWLDLHQTEFVNSDRNCMILLPIAGLASGQILAADTAWGQAICDAWQAAGYRPVPEPKPLGYTDIQADYLRNAWGDIHKRMSKLSTEVKNNAPDAPPEFQLQAQAIAITTSIERLL